MTSGTNRVDQAPGTASGRGQASRWMVTGAIAAGASIIAVLILQKLALGIWPEAALFAPLDSLARSALFTLIPAVAATAIFAWMTTRRPNAVREFTLLAGVLLLLSFIPDYLLPVPNRTLVASTIAAALHVVAALIIVGVLVAGYRRMSGNQSNK